MPKSPLDSYPYIPLCQFDSDGTSIYKECCDPQKRCCQDIDCRGLGENTSPDYPEYRPECVNTRDVKCIAQSEKSSKCYYEYCEDTITDEISTIDADNKFVSILGKWELEESKNINVMVNPLDKYTKKSFAKETISDISVKGEFKIQFSKISADIFSMGLKLIVKRGDEKIIVRLDDVCDINKIYSLSFNNLSFYGYRLWDTKIQMLQVENNILVSVPIKWGKLNFEVTLPMKKVGGIDTINKQLCEIEENFDHITVENDNTKSKISVQTVIGMIIGIITITIGMLLLLLYKD